MRSITPPIRRVLDIDRGAAIRLAESFIAAK
jgi:hypothetical protein